MTEKSTTTMQDVAPEPTIADLGSLRGSNQSGMRDHNERLVLTLIRKRGALAKSDIARITGLSAQTVSVIMRELERDGLLKKEKPLRGGVGKPSVPMALNPSGLYSVGLNIGRRSADLVLLDFVGAVQGQLKQTYAYPTPEIILKFLADGFDALFAGKPASFRRRLAGLGVASPFELWNWLDTVNAPKSEMQKWLDFDLVQAVADATGLAVHQQNDATSACTAEHLYGRGREFSDYAYFFIGSFIGGGVALNDTVFSGRTGNAGAFGTLPIRFGTGKDTQLIHNASLYLLERKLEEAGMDPKQIWVPENDWADFGEVLSNWIDRTASSLAVAAVEVCSVIDFECVLIDANCPPAVRRKIVEKTQAEIHKLDTRGISRPLVVEASVGRNARSIGAASLPFIANYLLAQPKFG
jgi:predicted NBD/HSP70 family sugar kinase